MTDQERLAAYDQMLQNVKDRYRDTSEQMETLKSEGKIRSVTYKQLMGEKMTLQKFLGMYQIYGIEV